MSSAQSQSKHHHHTADATERERERESCRLRYGSDIWSSCHECDVRVNWSYRSLNMCCECVTGWINELKHVSSVRLTGLKHVWSLTFPHARGLDAFSPRVDFACLNVKALAALNADYFKWSVCMQLPMDESAWMRLVSFLMWMMTPERPFDFPAPSFTPGIGWQREVHRSHDKGGRSNSGSLPVDLGLYVAGIWNGSFDTVEKCYYCIYVINWINYIYLERAG